MPTHVPSAVRFDRMRTASKAQAAQSTTRAEPFAPSPARPPLQPVTSRAPSSGTRAPAGQPFDLAALALTAPLQRKAELAGPEHPLEQEADRAADAALSRLARGGTALPADRPGVATAGPELAPASQDPLQRACCDGCATDDDLTRATPPIQRAEDDEAEAEATAAGALGELPLEGGDEVEADDAEGEQADDEEDASDEQAPIQARLATLSQPPEQRLARVREGVDSARGGGAPLDATTQARMETGFDADFSGVRIHADPSSAALAQSVQALAFTSGADIFFGQGRYAPGSPTGDRLLAHELAHVLQQGVAPAARRAPQARREAPNLQAKQTAHGPSGAFAQQARVAPGTIQTDRAKQAGRERLIGEFFFFDKKDDLFGQAKLTEVEPLGLSPGYYELKLVADGANYHATFVQGGQIRVEPTSDLFRSYVTKANRIFLRVWGEPAAPVEDDGLTPEPIAPPSTDDPTGPSNPAKAPIDEKSPAGGGAGDKPTDIEKSGERPVGKPGGQTPPSGPTGGATPAPAAPGDKGSDQGAAPPGGKAETEDDQGGADDKSGGGMDGKGADKPSGGLIPKDSDKKGSKYGWLGLLNLPQGLINFLESAIDVLGDGEELQSLRDTLMMLEQLASNSAEFQALFADPESLLEIALGLKESTAMDKIAAWVEAPTPRPKSAKNANLRGIIGLAQKVLKIVGKLRKLLKPVFTIRGSVQTALGSVGLLLEAAPALAQLMELVDDATKLDPNQLKIAADDAAVDLGTALRDKVKGLPKLLAGAFEKFTDEDLITYEELARVITSAVLKGVPKLYRPVVWAAEKLGLDSAIADNVVAHLIPKSALDGLNDAIKAVVKLAEPALKGATADLGKIIEELDAGLLEELPGELIGALKPATKSGGLRSRQRPAQLTRLLGGSTGEPLGDDTRTEAETRLGWNLGNVRIHRDSAANEANERLNTNAFTLGASVFFGPGKFDASTSGGRRLLYHELGHVLQQGERGQIAVQPDYKDLLKKLSKKVSQSALDALKGATATSPKKQKEATDIKDKVAKLVGRKVVSRTNPTLPTGYAYIPKNTGKIKTIRRALAWIRFIPALTIDKSRKIRLAAALSRFDPRAAARRALRAALGCKAGQEAHHVVPLELLMHSVAKTAIKNGWNFNGVDNGKCISDKIHSGSHKNYTAAVRFELDALLVAHGTDWSKLQAPFLKLISDQKVWLSKRKKRID
jgi:hypothetical protein